MKPVCNSCNKPKATLECGLCQCSLCKYCAQFVEEDHFSFLASIPSYLSHTVYCGPCFDEKISPELQKYDALLEQAKQVDVYFSDQGKETRIIRRLEEPVKIENCPDRDEALLRLAFFAAQGNYNSLVDVELTSEKVRNGGYQTLKWRGVGVPVHVNKKRLFR
jgi:hypothetical protein